LKRKRRNQLRQELEEDVVGKTVVFKMTKDEKGKKVVGGENTNAQ